jgi:hypothetical protein
MDVKLPNGTIVSNVPDDITQTQLQEIAIKNKLATPEDFGVVPPTAGESLQRGAGLAARAAITGASAIPNTVADFFSGLYNVGANLVGSPSRMPYMSQEQQQGLTTIGLPIPETTGEKVLSGTVSALAGGAAQTPLAVAKAPALAMATPAATAATAAAGAMAPAAFQGIKDYTGSDLAASLGSFGMSTVAAGLAGRTAGALTTEKNPKVSMEEVKQRAQRAYKAAEDSGVMIKPQSVLNMVGSIQKNLDDAGFVAELPSNKPVEIILNKFKDIVGTERVSISKLEQMRSLASSLSTDRDPNTSRLAGVVVSGIDDYLSSLASKDIMMGTGADAGKAVQKLMEARKDWRNLSRATILENVLTATEAKALNPSASESELIRQGFIGILANKNKANKFSSDEIAAMKAVAGGTPLDTALSMLGKLSPERSNLSTVAALASGQPILQAVAGGGLLSDKLNSFLRSNAARGLVSDVLSGNVRPPAPSQALMRGLMSGPQQQGTPTQEELNLLRGLTQ